MSLAGSPPPANLTSSSRHCSLLHPCGGRPPESQTPLRRKAQSCIGMLDMELGNPGQKRRI